MSEHDPDAWWSPVPGAPRTDMPAPATPPGSTPAQVAGAVEVPAVRPRRRVWPWVVGGTAALVVLVGVVLASTLGSGATKTLMDPGGTVSVAVPRSWYDNTGDPGSAKDQPPVLAASNLWQDRWVVVDRWDVDTQDTLASFHEDGIEQECAQQRCSSRSGAAALQVGGHDALEQVVVHPGDQDAGATTLVVLTVWAGDHAVELYAGATASGDTAPAAGPLTTIAGSLRLL